MRKLVYCLLFLLVACSTSNTPVNTTRQGIGGSAGSDAGTSCVSSYSPTVLNGTLQTLIGSTSMPAIVTGEANDCVWGSACARLLSVSPTSGGLGGGGGSPVYYGPTWTDAPFMDLSDPTCSPSWLMGGSRIAGRDQVLDAGPPPGPLPSVSVGDVVVFEKANQVWHLALVLGVDSTGKYPTSAVPVTNAASPGNVVMCSSTCDTAETAGFWTECIGVSCLGYSSCSADTGAVCADFWDLTVRSSWADVNLSGGAMNPPVFPGLRY
jgi:hypothetical protein